MDGQWRWRKGRLDQCNHYIQDTTQPVLKASRSPRSTLLEALQRHLVPFSFNQSSSHDHAPEHMATHGEDLSQWDQARQLGQILMCGFDGTSIPDELRTLIEEHFCGGVFLAPKNLTSAAQATQLCLDLQTIARAAGHRVPLLIAIDQENGGLNALSDSSLIHEFPSNLGLAATGSRSLTRQVAKATAQELKAVGINLILGPVLDVISDIHSQVLGPRSFGENPEQVSALGNQYINGCRDASIASCGKHFPSFEKIELLRADSPVNGSLHDLSRTSLAPFRDAIKNGVDAILVGDVAVNSADMSAMHACLSERIVTGFLRNDMKFRGVVVSECLELSLDHDVGIQGAAVMAVQAGCDLVFVCRSLPLQREALQGLVLGLEGGTLDAGNIEASVSRILTLKSKYTSWETALSPPGVQTLGSLRQLHRELSKSAYSKSVTVVRDSKRVLPLARGTSNDRTILLLTPLITPLPSAKFHSSADVPPDMRGSELVFQRFGAILGKHASTKVIQTSYSAHGLRSRHEELINKSVAVIVLTADARRNKYQRAFAKHVTLLCNQKIGPSTSKPCAVVAVTSPYDFAAEPAIDPYICTYDYTETALKSLVQVLCGESQARGKLPNSSSPATTTVSRQKWLVEKFSFERDSISLTNLLNAVRSQSNTAASTGLNHISAESFSSSLSGVQNHHFVVRNSSTKELFGFCAAYYIEHNASGHIGLLVVDPKRRRQSVGDSLHVRAIQTLEHIAGISTIQLGLLLPPALPGLPSNSHVLKQIREWFTRRGWVLDNATAQHRALLQIPLGWKPPGGLSQLLNIPDIKYEILPGAHINVGGFLEQIAAAVSTPVSTIYKLMPAQVGGTSIIRARNLLDGSTKGTILVCSGDSQLIRGMPANSGALLGLAVAGGDGHEATMFQILVLLGLKHLRKQGVESVLLDAAGPASHFHPLEQWGLQSVEVLGFETGVHSTEFV